MPIAAVADFLEVLRKNRLIEPSQLDELAAGQARYRDPRELARYLIQKGVLTPYQINQIFQGNAQDLVLGPYRILERLGEGGMGQVFKARHAHLDRVVALKVIRKDRLDSPTAVRRFQREIRAAAQLAHPNIVMAFDADQLGQTNFFVMEYVEGVDLNRLVKDSGPLPIDQACEYVRQAALGLQHAFECGLVHRDIKPANLLVSSRVVSGGVVSGQSTTHHSPLTTRQIKILDMGLARIGESGDGEAVSRLTQEGTVMGTPDFLAPEQAINSSTADVRADLYSLGCTFHFLLTGQVLFPGGTMMEKIMKHRSEQPPAINKLRPEVPAKVAAILRKLLAKKPEERYQTPAEVAEALAAVLPTLTIPDGTARSAMVLPGEVDSEASTQVQPPRTRRRRLKAILIGSGIVLLLVLIASKGEKPVNEPDTEVAASLLDGLPADQFRREPFHPKELVAILGKAGEQQFCVAISRDGKWLAAGGDDNLVRLWSLADLSERTLQPKHGGAVSAVAFHPDGKTLATGSQDGQVHLWDVVAGNLQDSWAAHEHGTDAVIFSPDGTRVVSAGEDYKIRSWDMKKAKRVERKALSGSDSPVYAMAVAPDGLLLASGGRDHFVRLWDVGKKGFELTRARQHTGAVLAVAFAPDGKILASGGRDNTVRLWNVPSGARPEFSVLEKHTDAVTGLAFAPASRPGPTLLASVGRDAQVVVWDVAARQVHRSWTTPWEMRGVAFAPDGRHLATANRDGTVAVFRIQNPE